MKIFLLIVVSLITLLVILMVVHLKYDRLIRQIWLSLQFEPTETIFTQDMVENLDEPVQRYFLHAIAPGTLLASYVELEMSGEFKLKPDDQWLPMQASQIISTFPGLVWKATIDKGFQTFSGADYYFQGRGRMRFSLWGLIPLVNAQNEHINRSAIGRLAAEHIWLPSALLPQN
ncbi:MAG: DUF6920 family protein, partial [Waterburya sp.]